MKRYIALFAPIFLISLSTFAQVGVGTTTINDSAILDIASNEKGVLLPRLSTIRRDAISNPAYGLIIFNTDTQTLEHNRSTTTIPRWITIQTGAAVTSNTTQSAKYTNDALTIVNLNTGSGTNVPLFGTELWNDNTSLFIPNTDEIIINEDGRYKVMSNISVISASSNARKSPEAYITVNSVHVGSFATTGYMRQTTNHNTSSLHLNEILELHSGDAISIRVRQAGNGTNATFRGVETSNIYIEKID